MSLLPQTLLNATNNEDQTLEIHSEILEPLSHSQTICRFEIPHKNILDADSCLIWKVYCDGKANNFQGDAFTAVPLLNVGLYDTIKRARLYVNGKIISELNEVGKYLAIQNDFVPQEVKTEVNDYFSYANNEIKNQGGQITLSGAKMMRTPNDKELGPKVSQVGHHYEVEASLKLHQLFAVLKDAQLDTNNIEGKIMIEIDWSPNNMNNAVYAGTNAQAHTNDEYRQLRVEEPRLILDFLTYNAEVQAQIRNSIWGEGGGINMPFREVALVRKTLNAVGAGAGAKLDLSMGMTGRAVQKIYVAKVMNTAQAGNDRPGVYGDCRSDLLPNQKWNIRVNDLMIYDRDVDNRAEEFNYLQQTGEKQYTCPPSTFGIRNAGIGDGGNRTANNDDIWVQDGAIAYENTTGANLGGAGNIVNCPTRDTDELGSNYQGGSVVLNTSTPVNMPRTREQVCGRKNYIGVNLAKYNTGAESPLNAMRIGSTPIIFNLNYSGTANDALTSQVAGTCYFWVEYLKLMNLKNGQITIMDM